MTSDLTCIQMLPRPPLLKKPCLRWPPASGAALSHITPYLPRIPHGVDRPGPGLSGSFDELGSRQITQFLEWAIQQLPDEYQSALRMSCRQRRGAREGEEAEETEEASWSVGSMCSGSDAPILVAVALTKAMQNVLGVNVKVMHQFSVEKSRPKQKFLKRMFEGSMIHLYEDVVEVGNKTHVQCLLEKEEGRRQRHQQLSLVPAVQALFAGFPCQDVSSYNLRQDKGTTIRDSTARTGSTFRGLLKFLKRNGASHGFQSVLLENVMGLMTTPKDAAGNTIDPQTDGAYFSNLDHCVHLLDKEIGWTFCARLTPTMFGVPIQRERIYILGIPRELFVGSGVSFAFARKVAREVLDAALVSSVRDLEDFMLPETHPDILSMKDRASNLTKCRLGQPRSSKAGWPEVHAQLLEQKGIPWWLSPIPEDRVLRDYPCLKLLNFRQLEILRLHSIPFPDTQGRTIDVSQGMSRCRVKSKTKAAIVTPASSIYLASRCRTACGREDLAFQCIHYGERQERLAEFEDGLIRDLAGNAWETTCAGVMMLAQQVILGLLAAGARAAQSEQPAALAALEISAEPPLQEPQPPKPARLELPAARLQRAQTLGLMFGGEAGESDLDDLLNWNPDSS